MRRGLDVLVSSVSPGVAAGLTLIVLGLRRGVLRLGLLHGAVVVHKDKGVGVLRVLVSLRAGVPRAEVALQL